MYEDLVKSMNPLPRFNLKWYENADLYSEGEFEDIIIKIIAENKPEDYTEAIAKNYNWSSYCHLTNIRQNILNWYPFKADASLLEIGCGMGALTGMFCDKVSEVTAVEMSKKRATATLLRCREKSNLEIIVGNLNDIEFEKKFDYITLIGVLEYQGSYTSTDNPYGDFLKKIRGLLKPDGKLLVAIENQYGLKYWCGAREDHTGLPFEGMNQYTLSNRKVRTFSKAALDNLLKESGFSKTFFYYPLPDYKLPTSVYSQDCLPNESNIAEMDYYYVPDNRTLLADEKAISNDIIQNNVFEFFANSFLVECTCEGTVGEVTYAVLNGFRYPEYQIGTKFTHDGKVVKESICGDKVASHLNTILENEKELSSRGLQVLESRRAEKALETDFCSLPLLETVLIEACRKNDKAKAYELLDTFYADILKSSDEVSWEKNILYSLDKNISPSKEKYGSILATGYIDMALRNAFYDNGRLIWFDQEWKLENVPAKAILFYALVLFYNEYKDADSFLPYNEVLEKYGLLAGREDFNMFFRLFTDSTMDRTSLNEFSALMTDATLKARENLQRFLQ
jgi:2-polyprenyl-3-methyl-5-hydroxy-6-metoxy-1,4-benzoquinol methylase